MKDDTFELEFHLYMVAEWKVENMSQREGKREQVDVMSHSNLSAETGLSIEGGRFNPAGHASHFRIDDAQ